MPDPVGMLRAAASLVAPPRCGLCGRPCRAPEPICGKCGDELARLRPSRAMLADDLDVISAAPYEGIARDLVAKMKFSARLGLADAAAGRMIWAWGATRTGYLVPVPAAPARARARGYDSAHTLAKAIRRATGVPLLPHLERDDGPRQVGRRRQDRLSDRPRISPVSKRVALPDHDLWLVDDVVTTGATLMACADVLRRAGSNRVRALTFARAD